MLDRQEVDHDESRFLFGTMSSTWRSAETIEQVGEVLSPCYDFGEDTVLVEKFGNVVRSGTVTDTPSLVAALNIHSRWAAEDGASAWFNACTDVFSSETAGSLSPGELEEYVSLGELKCQCELSEELLRNWFRSLCRKANDSCVSKEIMAAIDEALGHVDVEVFKDNPACLFHLADALLGKLDTAEGIPLTKQTWARHGATLFALHQTLVVIGRTTIGQLVPIYKISQRFKKRIEEIALEPHYYPYRYLARLIAQSLNTLAADGSGTAMMNGARSFFFGVGGNPCEMNGTRDLNGNEVDHEALDTALQHLKTRARGHALRSEAWYEKLLEVWQSSLKCIREPKSFGEFREICAQTCEDAIAMDRENRKMLRYSIIDQLKKLALHAPSAEVRSETFGMLLSLGERSSVHDSASEGWTDDVEIFEALVDALHSIHGQVDVDKATAIARVVYAMIVNRNGDTVSRTIAEWRNASTRTEKLAARRPARVAAESSRIFRLATQMIASLRRQRSLDGIRTELRRRYRSPDFAMLPSVCGNMSAKHVKDLHCQLALLGKPTDGDAGDTAREINARSQPSAFNQRAEPARKLSYMDLFEERVIDTYQPPKPIREILVVGNPGTGKTALSRKLAYQWSIGRWGTQFDAVYVLPVRRIKSEDYDDHDTCREKTLSTAIANICFDRRDDEIAYTTLREVIDEDLTQLSTLVIIDGLDEGAIACQEILREAKNGQTSLLMLSRAYGLYHSHRLVDIEVECVGLNDKQLTTYIHRSLEKEKAQLLEWFLFANKAVWDMAHVPVNAQILCSLVTEKTQMFEGDELNGSLLLLYRAMINFVWERFAKENDIRDGIGREALAALGAIGFDALDEGQISISEDRVFELIKERRLQAIMATSACFLLRSAGMEYQFPNLTFQEYFAGCYLAQKMAEGGHSAEEVGRFVAKNKYRGEFRVALCFMAEEVTRTHGVKGFKNLVSVVDKSRVEIFGLQHILLKLSLVEAFLGITKRSGRHESKVLDVAEPLVKTASAFLEHVLREKFLRPTVAEALEKAPNVNQAFPKYVRSVLGRARDGESMGVNHTPMTGKREKSTGGKKAAEMALLSPMRAKSTVPQDSARDRGTRTAMEETDSPSGGAPREAQFGDAAEGAILESSQSSLFRGTDGQNRTERGDHTQSGPEGQDEKKLRSFNSAEHATEAIEKLKLAVGRIPNLIASRCGREEDLIHALFSALRHSNHTIRSAAGAVIPSLIELYPNGKEELTQEFIATLRDDMPPVRSAAAKQIPKLIKLCPEREQDLILGLYALLCDANSDVHSAAVQQILDLIVICPGREQDLIQQFFAALRSSNSEVSIAALAQIPDLVSLIPQREDKLIQGFFSALQSTDSEVSVAALAQIPDLIKLCPEREQDLIQGHSSSLCCSNKEVRIAAAKQIVDLLTLCPGREKELIKSVSSALLDCTTPVREAVALQIPDLLITTLELEELLIQEFSSALHHSDASVRKAASLQLPNLIQLFSECFEVLTFLQLEAIETACEDETSGLSVSQIVGRLRGSSQNHNQWIKILVRLAKLKFSDVCKILVREYDRLPLPKLINLYWRGKNDALIECIVKKLPYSALTVYTRKDSPTMTLVLHSATSERNQWSRARKDVDQFLQAIKREIINAFHGLPEVI